MTPKRIQRKRTKGWRMPENAVYVGRPTEWGNPYEVRDLPGFGWCVSTTYNHLTRILDTCKNKAEATAKVVERYEDYAKGFRLELLRGKNLACWCPLDQPCHADVLLRLANAEAQ